MPLQSETIKDSKQKVLVLLMSPGLGSGFRTLGLGSGVYQSPKFYVKVHSVVWGSCSTATSPTRQIAPVPRSYLSLLTRTYFPQPQRLEANVSQPPIVMKLHP